MSAPHPNDVWAKANAYENYVGRLSRLVAAEFVTWLDLPGATGSSVPATLQIGKAGPNHSFDQRFRERRRRREMKAPLGAPVPFQRVRVCLQERARQGVDAAMGLPAGEPDQAAAVQLECRHAVADGLHGVRDQARDLGTQALQRLLLVRRQCREVGVNPRVASHSMPIVPVATQSLGTYSLTVRR